jgi:hypothetical protein
MRLQLGKEIASENRTRSQLKKVKKGASPDYTRRIELAFARGGGKQRLASSRDANRSDRSPSPSLTQQASGDGQRNRASIRFLGDGKPLTFHKQPVE